MKNDTICAIATGATNAGISIIRISGEDAFTVADRIFVAKKTGKKLADRKTHTLTYGNIVSDNEIVDEVLVSVMRAPNSYTAENVAEINCHGGYAVTKKILELCIKAGARLAEPGEFTKRAFLNGRMDLSQAEAVIDLINASNEDAVKNSVAQLSGKLRNKVVALREKILKDTAYIEAALDDPEHMDLTGFTDELSVHVNEEMSEIKDLLSGFENGRLIQNGIRTVILGKPNAGKSTLLNALTGTHRAIVTDIPGTTRDILEEIIVIDGITLNIVDTAGIHDTEDVVEKIGVEKAVDEIENADLCLFVADASRALDDDDRNIIRLLDGKKAVVLLNKSDLSPVLTSDDLKKACNREVISISAKDETGIDIFVEEIKKLFGFGKLGKKEDFYISKLRHKELLENALLSLKEVLKSIDLGMSEDFFSIDLMNAYTSLGSIIGEEIGDDLADKIFKEFCMGK
ncbi:MAG: tRNA uridine-5-carboxymethylaminomethyl(34) synthesis GTPase MnmE [Lachnospiraceae bacterium]|nr:tRNA uridine-5-carboxymethylaminomethyl(34) synthesis GTPase MnmE [Lachnospiraceae bacterium]